MEKILSKCSKVEYRYIVRLVGWGKVAVRQEGTEKRIILLHVFSPKKPEVQMSYHSYSEYTMRKKFT